MATPRSKEDLSLGELFAELTRELSTLVRQELTLATTEMTQKGSRVAGHVGSLAAGGAVAYAGFLAILAGIILGLAYFIPLWLSALVVGLVVAAVGGFLVQSGLTALKHEDLTPRQTVQTLKEDAQWAKQQMS
jgi:hypothetical protein